MRAKGNQKLNLEQYISFRENPQRTDLTINCLNQVIHTFLSFCISFQIKTTQFQTTQISHSSHKSFHLCFISKHFNKRSYSHLTFSFLCFSKIILMHGFIKIYNHTKVRRRTATRRRTCIFMKFSFLRSSSFDLVRIESERRDRCLELDRADADLAAQIDAERGDLFIGVPLAGAGEGRSGGFGVEGMPCAVDSYAEICGGESFGRG